MSKTNLARKTESLTDAEYLRVERQAFEKSELINGRIKAMAGASENHNIISSNVFGELWAQTKNTECRAFASDMRVKAKRGNYYYPDVVIVCGERRYEDEAKDVLLNPNVVIEVLSKSTRLKDRNEKFDSYLSLAAITDYVLIEQDETRVEHYFKVSEHDWNFRLLTEKTDRLTLASINCEITLEDIYREVEFSK